MPQWASAPALPSLDRCRFDRPAMRATPPSFPRSDMPIGFFFLFFFMPAIMLYGRHGVQNKNASAWYAWHREFMLAQIDGGWYNYGQPHGAVRTNTNAQETETWLRTSNRRR